MKYLNLNEQQRQQERDGRVRALERQHYLKSLDLKMFQAQADATEGEARERLMQNVGAAMQELRDIEVSLQALGE